MTAFQQTVQQTLESERIGIPVFVRWLTHLPCNDLAQTLAAMLEIAQSWLQAEPVRLYVQGDEGGKQLTASVVYAAGQTALVTAVRLTSEETPKTDLMLLGNRGAIYHAAAEDSRPAVFDTPPASATLARAVATSCGTGQPIAMREGEAN